MKNAISTAAVSIFINPSTLTPKSGRNVDKNKRSSGYHGKRRPEKGMLSHLSSLKGRGIDGLYLNILKVSAAS